MIGNAEEWVAHWRDSGGAVWGTGGYSTTPWVWTGYGDKADKTYNFNNKTLVGTSTRQGLPAAGLRGGGGAGIFSYNMSYAPAHSSSTIGARCCRWGG